MTLFAVHISDGVLTWPWLAGGFVVAAALLGLSSWRLRDDEIPRIAILTAAFFVSSAIHIKIPGTSIHLLLVGLVGVVLGFRAALAIFIGLVLQVFLMEHGGRWTLGINTCVMTLPALLSFLLFRGLHQIAWIKTPFGRGLLVGVGAAILFMSGVYSLTLICNTSIKSIDESAIAVANAWVLDPFILLGTLLFAIVAVAIERRLENTPEFPLGFLIGELSVLITVALNGIVLLAGGEQSWPMPPLLLVIAHLPFAVVEGIILGFVVGFLAKVKPEMLGILNHGGHGDHGEPPVVESSSTLSKSREE